MQNAFKTIGLFSLLILIGAGCLGGTTVTRNDEETFSGSLQTALQLGKAMKCTWSSDEGEGVTYIKGDKVRTEATTDGETGYIIGNENCTYIWQEGESEGIEFCQDESTTLTGEPVDEDDFTTNFGSDDGFDPDPGVDVDCRVQKVDDSLFDPPSDINFTNPLEGLLNF